MLISKLCTKNLVYVEEKSSLQRAAQLMKKKHVGSLVVVVANGHLKPVGIITDRDIVISAAADNLPMSTKVSEIMTKDVFKVKNSERISEVIELMEIKGLRRVLVIDNDDRTCGIVTSDDILKFITSELNSLGRISDRQILNEKIFKPANKQLTYQNVQRSRS